MSTKTTSRKNAIKKYFRNLLNIRGDMMSHEELCEMMEENTIIHGSNMWILMLAILIASIGLNVNSTAVIIGAMLISPLMSGILTMGYSLATCDLTMLRKAFTGFVTQVVISLITSTIYFLITPLDDPTSEMIARTSPTLWDVLIALFGGVAGMIGNTRQKKSNVIPGVAIATALMPPLCTAGYGIATLQLRFFLGAFYLFAINTLFIMLSSAFVTRLLRVPTHDVLDRKKQKRIKRVITSITVITIIPSILVGGITVFSSAMERKVSNYLSNEMVFTDTQMVQSSTDHVNHVISVSLVGATISDDVIARLEQELTRYDLKDYTLHVTQNRITEIENTDKVTIALQENTIGQLQDRLTEQQKTLDEQAKTIDEMREQLAEKVDYNVLSSDVEQIFTKLTDCGCGLISTGNGEYILLTANAAEPLTAEEEQAVKNWLSLESGLDDIRLNIVEPSVNDDQP
ncbi:MAG: DUF389 domain-containing protein [Bacteroides sp.]|nr:DUF389 domain-containing protein [Eubacterium sp.]MCM1417242.1 DUF389 domain-containing protein [Roseburia sp.]MCM1461138.1 DUF389 domain-containing protein [Bacteroides sp.]